MQNVSSVNFRLWHMALIVSFKEELYCIVFRHQFSLLLCVKCPHVQCTCLYISFNILLSIIVQASLTSL